MKDIVRWTVTVSRETDTALCGYVAQRGMKKGDISKFVEEAVRWRVLDRVVSEVKTRNAGNSARKIQHYGGQLPEVQQPLVNLR